MPRGRAREDGSRPSVEVLVEALAAGGDGLAHLPDGRAVFVPGSAPGDRLRLRITEEHKTYARARVEAVLHPGPDRVAPPCPAFDAGCGGCAWQHLAYSAQNAAKLAFLREALRRIGGMAEPPLETVLAAAQPYHYRNKAQVPVAGGSGASLRLGYYRRGSHDVVPLPEEGCRLLAPAVDAALSFVRAHLPSLGLRPYEQSRGTGTLRHVMVRANTRGQAMVVLVTREPLPAAAAAAAASWLGQAGIASVQNNVQAKPGNVILGGETRVLAGPATLEEELDGLRYRLSATSFFQVNVAQTLVLLKVLEGIRPWTAGESVLELYCGVGTLSLALARRGCRVHGVELHATAVEDARAAAAANALDTASFSVGGAAQGWLGLPPGFVPTILLVDPPRKGLEPAVFETLKRQATAELVYVSCDPASLARDAKNLAALGYRLEKAVGVDLFPQTAHVECVCRFVRDAPQLAARKAFDLAKEAQGSL